MNQKFHPGPHPDADRLSIFVEGADTARERDQILAHLAECQECRDVVFLVRRPVETASAAKEISGEWVWQRWLLPVGLAGAALAGLALSLVYLRPSATVPESIRQSAAVQQPEIGLPATPLRPSGNPVPVPQAENDKNIANRLATSAAKQKSEGAADLRRPNEGSPPASASVPAQGTETSVSSAAAVAEATPPKPAAQLDENSAARQQLPFRGRNVMSVQLQATPPSASAAAAPAAAAQDSVKAPQNFAALQVEPLSGQDGALTGISGRVTDISGAVVPGATVALRDASGSARQTATGSDGSFRLTGMPAGHYDLTVTAQGFKTNQQAVDLKPSELAMLQPVLNVGSITQEVTVSASAARVETGSTSVASLASKLPSRFPIGSSASVGQQVLSLDDASTLFLSRDAGKSWKKVHPQWAGKAIRIDLTPAEQASANAKSGTAGAETAPSVFQLTTDSGAQWTSKDGTHWRPK